MSVYYSHGDRHGFSSQLPTRRDFKTILIILRNCVAFSCRPMYMLLPKVNTLNGKFCALYDLHK